VIMGLDANGATQTKNIEEVEVGDWVLSRSDADADGPLELKQVTAVHVTTVDHLWLLEIQEPDGTQETIRTTDEHPFWVEGLGWVKAKDLQVGQVSSDNYNPASATIRIQHDHGGSFFRECCPCRAQRDRGNTRRQAGTSGRF